jgi:CRP-like cAMP-binding protein
MFGTPTPNENGVLAALAPTVYERLAPCLKRVRLDAGRVLLDIGDASHHLWFVTSGIVSEQSITRDGKTLQVAAVGPDGVIGLSGIINGNKALYRSQVQIAGEALQISAAVFRNVLRQEREGIECYELLLGYMYSLSEQIAQSALCNQYHRMEQRLASRLLLTQDRLSTKSFAITHETISNAMGVSRSVVTQTIGEFQEKGFISCSRGRIAILNRGKLRFAACECHKIISRVKYFHPLAHTSETQHMQLH